MLTAPVAVRETVEPAAIDVTPASFAVASPSDTVRAPFTSMVRLLTAVACASRRSPSALTVVVPVMVSNDSSFTATPTSTVPAFLIVRSSVRMSASAPAPVGAVMFPVAASRVIPLGETISPATYRGWLVPTSSKSPLEMIPWIVVDAPATFSFELPLSRTVNSSTDAFTSLAVLMLSTCSITRCCEAPISITAAPAPRMSPSMSRVITFPVVPGAPRPVRIAFSAMVSEPPAVTLTFPRPPVVSRLPLPNGALSSVTLPSAIRSMSPFVVDRREPATPALVTRMSFFERNSIDPTPVVLIIEAAPPNESWTVISALPSSPWCTSLMSPPSLVMLAATYIT